MSSVIFSTDTNITYFLCDMIILQVSVVLYDISEVILITEKFTTFDEIITQYQS